MKLFLKPYKDKYRSQRESKRTRVFLDSLTVPDRAELKKEAMEFEAIVLARRAALSHGKNA